MPATGRCIRARARASAPLALRHIWQRRGESARAVATDVASSDTDSPTSASTGASATAERRARALRLTFCVVREQPKPEEGTMNATRVHVSSAAQVARSAINNPWNEAESARRTRRSGSELYTRPGWPRERPSYGAPHRRDARGSRAQPGVSLTMFHAVIHRLLRHGCITLGFSETARHGSLTLS